jgi:hypothetical protein
MERRRRVARAVLLGLLAVGGGQASSQPPAAAPADEHRFVHVHEFPTIGKRIAPPTGRPRLSWQQALAAVTRRNVGWPAPTPPQVKLADYANCCNGEGPVRPRLAWIVVYPDAEEVSFGPDFRPDNEPVGRCPAYVAVDAASGRGWGSFQTCDPPYRG